jgi:hypothetical protein
VQYLPTSMSLPGNKMHTTIRIRQIKVLVLGAL